jgi:DNA-binding transcriptional regulator YbjK
LLDEAGFTIPILASGCTIKIISLADYIGEEYTNLANNYQSLSKTLNDTIILTKQLTFLYNSTKNNYDTLNNLYASLNAKYDSLNSNYITLETNYNTQLTNLNSLQISNEQLRSSLVNQTNILYVFIATTAIFLVTTIFLAMRKPRKVVNN